jgi:hypothetical protein
MSRRYRGGYSDPSSSTTMMAVLLVVGLVIGGGVGYFAAPKEITTAGTGDTYQRGYDKGYDEGFQAGKMEKTYTRSDSELMEAVTGLTTLVYGAIGASLIAALAAIVALMQVSRRIAG